MSFVTLHVPFKGILTFRHFAASKMKRLCAWTGISCLKPGMEEKDMGRFQITSDKLIGGCRSQFKSRMCLRCPIEHFVPLSMPEEPHHFLSAHASVNQMDKLAPHADSDGLHTSTLHQVPLARARPQMLFVFQEECVFVRAKKENRRSSERAAGGGSCGVRCVCVGGALQQFTKQGTQNRSCKQPRRRHFRSHLLPA